VCGDGYDLTTALIVVSEAHLFDSLVAPSSCRPTLIERLPVVDTVS